MRPRDLLRGPRGPIGGPGGPRELKGASRGSHRVGHWVNLISQSDDS